MLHAAGDIGDVAEAVLEHPFAGVGAADAGGAVDEVLGIFWEAIGGSGPTGERKEFGPIDVGHKVFVLLADVEEDALEALGEDLAKFEGRDFWKRSHFFLIVERLRDGGIGAAERTIGIAFDFDFAEGCGEGAVVNEATEWRLAESGQELDRFHGLKASNDSREHAQDTGFGSGRDGSLRRSFGEKAAVAGSAEVGGEDGDLSFKLEDGAVNEGLFEEVSGVVGGEAGGEVVGAIEDGVVGGEEIEAVTGLETAGMRDHFDERVDLAETLAGAIELRGANAVGVVENLAMEV
ncbi:MAG: hypothetical protein ACJAVK_001088 [Akkermansiaceae bacterium]